jgi:hypothetical protein
LKITKKSKSPEKTGKNSVLDRVAGICGPDPGLFLIKFGMEYNPG